MNLVGVSSDEAVISSHWRQQCSAVQQQLSGVNADIQQAHTRNGFLEAETIVDSKQAHMHDALLCLFRYGFEFAQANVCIFLHINVGSNYIFTAIPQ